MTSELERLLVVQGIGPNDLAALREGRTCAFAQSVITRSFRVVWIILIVGFATGAVAIGAWIMAAMIKPEHTVELAGIPVAWTAIFMLFPLICFPLAMHRAWVLARERSAPIERCEGIVKTGWTGGKASKAYITLGEKFFVVEHEPVLKDLFEHVIPGTPMRFYVTANRRIVVGAEPLTR